MTRAAIATLKAEILTDVLECVHNANDIDGLRHRLRVARDVWVEAAEICRHEDEAPEAEDDGRGYEEGPGF